MYIQVHVSYTFVSQLVLHMHRITFNRSAGEDLLWQGRNSHVHVSSRTELAVSLSPNHSCSWKSTLRLWKRAAEEVGQRLWICTQVVPVTTFEQNSWYRSSSKLSFGLPLYNQYKRSSPAELTVSKLSSRRKMWASAWNSELFSSFFQCRRFPDTKRLGGCVTACESVKEKVTQISKSSCQLFHAPWLLVCPNRRRRHASQCECDVLTISAYRRLLQPLQWRFLIQIYSHYCAICLPNAFRTARKKTHVCSRSVRSILPGHRDFGTDQATKGENNMLSLISSYRFQLLNQTKHDDNKQHLPVFRRKRLQIERARSQTCQGSRAVTVKTKRKSHGGRTVS